MARQLIEGLGLASRLLLQYAARKDHVAGQLASVLGDDEDPADAVTALQERGLLAPSEYTGIFTLTPMGLALRGDIVGSWPALHDELRERLVVRLLERFELSDDSPVARALRAVDRACFLPTEAECLADLDIPLPTGVGDMTTSAPHVLVAILEAVTPGDGDRVLVCGAKGGVTLALGTWMAGTSGYGVAVDWEPDTVAHVRRSLLAYPGLAARCEVVHQPDVTVGYAPQAPYDVVVVNGSIPKIPRPLVDQLADGGRLLFFLHEANAEGQACYVVHKNRGVARYEPLSRFTFTPIYGRFGWDRIEEIAEGRAHG